MRRIHGPMRQWIVCELAEHFCVAFCTANKKWRWNIAAMKEDARRQALGESGSGSQAASNSFSRNVCI